MALLLPLPLKPHLGDQSLSRVNLVKEPAGDAFHGRWLHAAERPHDSPNGEPERAEAGQYWVRKPMRFRSGSGSLICHKQLLLCMEDGLVVDLKCIGLGMRPRRPMMVRVQEHRQLCKIVNLVHHEKKEHEMKLKHEIWHPMKKAK